MFGRKAPALVLGCGILACASALITGAEANAQAFVMSGGPGMLGAGMEPPVTSREVIRYSKALGFGEDQTAAAEALFEGFETEFHAAAEKFQEKMREVRAEFEETRDPAVFMEGMGPARREFESESNRLETQFIEDFRLLLSEDQGARWPKVERMRRRDRDLPMGMLSAESVDLLKLVDDLKLGEESTEILRPTLEQYELDLDRALEQKSQIRAEQRKLFEENGGGKGGMEVSIQSEEFQALNEKAIESSKQIRDLNRRYARQLSSALQPSDAARLDSAFQEAAHPDVYRETYASRVLRAADEFGDLTAEQRETLRALTESYDRELASANAQWAAAIEESEEQLKGMMAIGGGPGGRMMMMQHDGEDSKLEESRRARRELDNKIVDSVKSLLSEEQVARLPKRGEARQEGGAFSFGGGGAVMVRTMEWSNDGGETQQEVTIHVMDEGAEGGSGDGG